MIELVSVIDHTLLRPDATSVDLQRLCDEAVQHGFATVCVNGTHVAWCSDRLRDGAARVCTVVGFPLGAATTRSKAFEAGDAVQSGASEIDMVINVGALKDKAFDRVRDDIAAVVKAARPALVKVIIETGLLDRDEKVNACSIACDGGARFVKTSTGFGHGGATESDVALMRATVGSGIGVKASGGVRTRAHAVAMLAAGATRLGTSAGVAIASESTP